MGYVYAAMWLIVGIYLIYTGAKENRLFCFLGAYFVFLSIWWFVDEWIPVNMLDGVYAVVLRCISGAIRPRCRKSHCHKIYAPPYFVKKGVLN